ncbi:MAG: AAA family ATPase, partial [Methylobacter sp.]
MKKKIQTLLEQMNHGLIERENTVKSVLLTVLAGENLVLIGPPGTGKSMVARRVADNLDITQGNGYFEYLLTKFSTPEEIFGSLSISELKADRFKRNTEGYLPTVQIAFLDEIFKASSSILNSLLTILNERVFHNGSEAQKVPLLSLISASNELPTGEEELKALYDRFLVRCFVDYVREENLPKLFENTPDKPILEKLTQHDFIEIQKNTEAIIIPTQIMEAVCAIWIEHKNTFKEDNRETLSDRRLKKILKLLRTSAATNGRKDVDLSDVMLLKDCLWNHYDNAEKVRSLIIKTLQKYSHAVSITLQDDSKTTEDTASFTHNKSTTFTHNKSTTGKIKGFVGSGTEHDPILIQSLHDFVDISRPDIGTKDYYFRQTTDMDCVSLTHWKPMDFQGHYDGDGHSIKNLLKNADKLHYVFSHIKPKSSITNLKLEECVLVDFIENSKITYCQSDANLVTNAKNCEIYHCESDASLIANNADGCEVSHCESDASLIANNADGCEISHCGSDTSLIVNNADGCEISHCQTNASLIAANANDCEISRCEVGKNLVSGNATNCRISECNAQSNLVGNASDSKIIDCAVNINESISYDAPHSSFGIIASELDKDSLVERCV